MWHYDFKNMRLLHPVHPWIPLITDECNLIYLNPSAGGVPILCGTKVQQLYQKWLYNECDQIILGAES